MLPLVLSPLHAILEHGKLISPTVLKYLLGSLVFMLLIRYVLIVRILHLKFRRYITPHHQILQILNLVGLLSGYIYFLFFHFRSFEENFNLLVVFSLFIEMYVLTVHKNRVIYNQKHSVNSMRNLLLWGIIFLSFGILIVFENSLYRPQRFYFIIIIVPFIFLFLFSMELFRKPYRSH
jgi:hypothetical protein